MRPGTWAAISFQETENCPSSEYHSRSCAPRRYVDTPRVSCSVSSFLLFLTDVASTIRSRYVSGSGRRHAPDAAEKMTQNKARQISGTSVPC